MVGIARFLSTFCVRLDHTRFPIKKEASLATGTPIKTGMPTAGKASG